MSDIPRDAPFLRTEWNYDMNAASVASGLECKDESLTQVQFQEESDINTIVERFGLSGELPSVVRLPTFDDFTGVSDFQTAMNAVVQAERDFMELPAKLRARFNNSPQSLLEFLADDANKDEAVKLGLVETPAVAPVPPVVVTPSS